MTDPNELIAGFVVESNEGLDQVARDLTALAADPADGDALHSIYRTFHTIKGGCGFLGFAHLETVTHAAEDLLTALCDGEFPVTRDVLVSLASTLDSVRAIVAGIEATGHEVVTEHARLRAQFERESSTDPELLEAFAATQRGAKKLKGSRKINKMLKAVGSVTDEHLSALRGEAREVDDDRRSTGDATVRVDVGLLDQLMNLIGELVLARNQLVQLATDRHDTEYLVPAQRLNIITSELQAGVMKTRMQPIGSVWQRLPRVVRDLTVSLGKQVRIEVDGAETELDRTILEAIKDPLTHLVRNSVDHGIELPGVREAAGKSVEGTLALRAFHESGKMNIEISDDGAGIDPVKIRAKAVSSGVMSAEAAGRASDREILSCIFMPGFSTAEKVTNISGRGVGMDVVKTNIEKIGGSVEISSEVGRGTTIRIKIPLTLAIIPALVVLSGGQRYVIPQINLVELVRLDSGEMSRRVEMIHGAPVYRLRGRLLPIVDLSDVLAGGSGIDVGRSLAGSGGRSVNVVVLQADGQSFGLIVDGVFDTQEIVVKPLGKQLRDIPVFAGATIMGDGKLALILDVVGLARETGVMKEQQADRPLHVRSTATNDARTSASLVVVGVGTEQSAIPLTRVARLERFAAAQVEQTQGRSIVQYRGELLPLIDLAASLGQCSTNERGDGNGDVSVLVHTIGDRTVGIIVDHIIDITDSDIDQREASGYVLGTAVINQRVTTVIDTSSLLESMLGESVSFEERWADDADWAATDAAADEYAADGYVADESLADGALASW